MTISPTAVHFDDETMCVDLADGRSLKVPLTWFPRLLQATPAQREHVELSRTGLHWEAIDEDISVAGLLTGQRDNTKNLAQNAILTAPPTRTVESPRAFVSHASEDKAFIIPLATELRQAGVDAWVDEWEIRPGDSLVQKIFEEGIGKAAVVIVALSRVSVTKKWVKEELDAAVVARINKTSRLIPLLIEDCDVPISLQASKWIRAAEGIDAVAKEIVRTIFDMPNKPPIGTVPEYLRSPLSSVHGLDQVDLRVLLAIGECYLEKGSPLASRDGVMLGLRQFELNEGQVDDSLGILSEGHYVEPLHTIGRKFAAVKLGLAGATIVLRNKFPDFDAHYRRISATLVNDEVRRNDEIAQRLTLPPILVNHVLDDLESKSLIKMSKSISGPRFVIEVSPRLKRSLQ